MMRFLFPVMLFILAACSTVEPCNIQSERFLTDIKQTTAKWDDAFDLAAAAPLISLSGAVSDLQTIKREAEFLKAPECSQPVKSELLIYMDHSIAGFLAFLAQKPNDEVEQKFSAADEALKKFGVELEKLKVNLEPYN